jgi:hypothetical protein
LHSEYIAFGQATITSWQKLMISSVTIAFILLSGLSVFSFLQRQQAVKQRLRAEKNEGNSGKGRGPTICQMFWPVL